jgi:hypothetical protein
MKLPSRHKSAPENKRKWAPSSPAQAGAAETQTQQTAKAAAKLLAALTRLPIRIEAPKPQYNHKDV